MKLKISNAELRKYLNISPPNFPKYTASIINLANQFAQGIDGFLNNIPVSIKPATYKSKSGLQERIKEKFIYYEKKKDGVEITFEDF